MGKNTLTIGGRPSKEVDIAELLSIAPDITLSQIVAIAESENQEIRITTVAKSDPPQTSKELE
jgi:hypothetical protein